MHNKAIKKDQLIPLQPIADITNRETRRMRANAMGISLRQYEQTLRHIGVDYLNH